jgi:hypothetical protein
MELVTLKDGQAGFATNSNLLTLPRHHIEGTNGQALPRIEHLHRSMIQSCDAVTPTKPDAIEVIRKGIIGCPIRMLRQN